MSVQTQPVATRRWLFGFLSIGLALFVSITICEAIFRVLETRSQAESTYEGKGGLWSPDQRWGWKPQQGYYHIKNDEFNVQGEVNALSMNDEPYEETDDAPLTRILVLGDSHTYATGVAAKDTWGKVLEHQLNGMAKSYRVYNGGVTGFNVHQYLLRLIDQGPQLRPEYVVIGLSYATDLYDLLPPDHGGWIYGNAEWPRDYFDLNSAGVLEQRRYEPSKTVATATEKQTNAAQSVRRILDRFATFRYLRRSNLALWIGSHVRVGGQSLWPNMEIVVEKETPPEHQYQWRLFEALLLRIKQESERQNAKLIVVGIPYLAQVYDEIWNISFGNDSRFSQTAAIERVTKFCQEHGIDYVDTRDVLRARVKKTGRWVHYRKDAHPTAEGHQLIAETVFKSGLIQARVANSK